MDKIKRNTRRSTGRRTSPFLRALVFTLLGFVMIALGFFGAGFVSGLFV